MSAFVQQGAISSLGTGAGAPTISGVTAGNTLICVYATNTAVSLSAPTDSSGQTWSLAVNQNGSGSSIAVAYLFNANAGAHNLTWASQASQNSSCISEWAGITGTGNAGIMTSAFAVATLTSGVYKPSQPNEVVIAVCMEQGNTNPDNIGCSTVAFGSIGSTTDHNSRSCIAINQNGTTSDVLEANAQVVSSLAPLSVTWTWTPAENAITAIVGFKFGPIVTAQPVSQTCAPGATQTYSVSATASAGSLSYQWYSAPITSLYSGVPGTFSPIGGATSSSYTTPTQSAANNGTWYYCAVTDSSATVNTAMVRGWVTGNPSAGKGLLLPTSWLHEYTNRDFRHTGNIATKVQNFGATATTAQASKQIWTTWLFGSPPIVNPLIDEAWDHFHTSDETDDDSWIEEASSPVGANGPTPSAVITVEDPFDHFTTDDDDQVQEDQYSSSLPPVVPASPEDAWFHWDSDGYDWALSSGGFQTQDIQPQIEDPWDHWVTDDDDQVDVVEFQLTSVAPVSTQYYGEDAELLDQDDEQIYVDDQLALQGDAPIEDGWDWWSQEDDDYVVSENYSPDGVLQYFGEHAELLDQDDDDQVVIDSQPTLQGDAPIEDAWDHWFSTEDDDYVVIDDYALIENLIPVEDAWDHFVTDDDDQVCVDEFQLISVLPNVLHYFGEDAELLDQDDDDQVYPDTDVIGATLAQTFDDPWEHWSTEDDDYVVTDDYASVDNNPVICIEDAWDWAEQGDEDAPVPEDYAAAVIIPPTLQYFGEDAEWTEDDSDSSWLLDETTSVPDDPAIADAWDHFATEEDDVAPADEAQNINLVLNPALCIEDPWDHCLTDDSDDYYVADDYALISAGGLAIMVGISIAGGLSFGICLGAMPVVFQTFDPRFFNGSNAWLGYRTASGGGVW